MKQETLVAFARAVAAHDDYYVQRPIGRKATAAEKAKLDEAYQSLGNVFFQETYTALNTGSIYGE